MNASRAKDAVGIEGAFEFFVDGKQTREELLDAVTIVAAAEQGRMPAGIVPNLECP